MKLDAKLKGGLAWAGLFVVLAVPSANVLLGQPTSANALTPTSDMSAVKTDSAPVAADPIETASTDAKAPIKLNLDTGKAVPAAEPVAVAAKPETKAPAIQPKSTEVAAIEPTPETPPVPLPRSARPKATEVATAAPASTAAPGSIAAPADAEKPLILDEKEVAAANRVEPFPLSDTSTDPAPGDSASADDQPVISGDQLEEWDSGSLADYLDKKGLITPTRTTKAKATSDNFDPDGFFLDEGPNRQRQARPQRDFFLF